MSNHEGFFGFLRHPGFLAVWISEAAMVLWGCCYLREWIVLPVALLILAFMPGFNSWVYGAFPAGWQKTKKN